MKWLSYLFILFGIILISYPISAQIYSNHIEKKLLEEAMNIEFEPVIQEVGEEEFLQLQDVFLEEDWDVFLEKKLKQDERYDDPILDTPVKKSTTNQPIGHIEIPTIQVQLPLLDGATEKNMRYAAGRLKETAKPGEIGNSAIAAHRSYTYGRFFNRLDEVKIGDEIHVNYMGKRYTYTVFETKVVVPTDLSVLYQPSSDKILTLITCTPIDTATHRLIVHAKM
ncbi:sortase A [Salirhabdus euzebyi]|uniref:Sortase A n=1 Tax=Salirhabdus euzebyi TaxID=394506 RepID=A0A841PV03_9BACI|nr:class D sortase [Salirhabdus euzebyi]MBB6452699.1 sortase A [Salirhabdus euzebyi]